MLGESRAALAGAGSTALPLSSCFGSWQQPPGEVGHAWRPPGARAGSSHCPRHDSAAPEVGDGEGAVGGRWWGRCEVTRPAHFGWAHTERAGGWELPQSAASLGAPAHLVRETEAERGLHRCGHGEGREMRGCGPPFGATPRGRVVRAGKSVSTSVVRVVTRDLAVSGGRGSLPAYLLHSLSMPSELLRAGN